MLNTIITKQDSSLTEEDLMKSEILEKLRGVLELSYLVNRLTIDERFLKYLFMTFHGIRNERLKIIYLNSFIINPTIIKSIKSDAFYFWNQFITAYYKGISTMEYFGNFMPKRLLVTNLLSFK